MQWEREGLLIPVKSTFELSPCDLLSMDLKTSWLATLITFFNVVLYLLDIVLFNYKLVKVSNTYSFILLLSTDIRLLTDNIL